MNMAIGRLSLLSAHDALILFKTAFSVHKMMHQPPFCWTYDSQQRRGICAIANLNLSDFQWLQSRPAYLWKRAGSVTSSC